MGCGMSFFDELKTPLEEAVDIKNGAKALGNVTSYAVAEMVKALGTSLDTIKSWESRRRNLTGLAAKVLAAIQAYPAFFRELAAHR